MNNSQIIANKDRLDFLFEKVKILPEDLELQAHWARYLCVLVSGFLEKSISLILKEYTKNNSSPCVVNFVEKKIGRFQNAKMERILELIASFNSDWANALKKELSDETKDSVDSIVANKNNIVHGASVGITYSRIKKYYEDSVILIEKTEKLCY